MRLRYRERGKGSPKPAKLPSDSERVENVYLRVRMDRFARFSHGQQAPDIWAARAAFKAFRFVMELCLQNSDGNHPG